MGFRSRLDQQRREWPINGGLIVLAKSAAMTEAHRLDCVIWAGGLQTTNSIPSSWLYSRHDPWNNDPTYHDQVPPLRIIDFKDRKNKTMNDWRRKRRRDYARRDIFDCGVSRSEGRMQMFLDKLSEAKRD